MDFKPQVETAEISDSELDGVSGGLLGNAVGNTLGTVTDLAPVDAVEGTVTNVTGVDVSAVTGVVGL